MEVFPTTERLEIFANESGSITLKQDGVNGEEESIIIVPVKYVDEVISSLREAESEAEE